MFGKVSKDYINCFICGGHEHKDFNYLPHPCSGSYSYNKYVFCKKCGLVFMNSKLSEEMRDTLYVKRNIISEGWKKYTNAKYKKSEIVYDYVNSLLHRYGLSPDKSKLVVEIGANDGSLLYLLKKNGYDVIGVEPTAQLCLYAKNRFGIDLINDYFHQDMFKPSSLDLVLCLYTIEHFNDPKQNILYIHNFLKPGGYLYLEVPHIFEPTKKIFGGGHITLFSKKTMARMLKISGFEILLLDTNGYHQGRFTGLRVFARKNITVSNAINDGRDKYMLILLNIYYVFYMREIIQRYFKGPVRGIITGGLKKVLPRSIIGRLKEAIEYKL